MNSSAKPRFSFVTLVVIFGTTGLLGGCGSSQRVSRTTTQQTTVSTPAPDPDLQPTTSKTTTTTTIQRTEPQF